VSDSKPPFEDQTFFGQHFVIDDKQFVRCTFRDCTFEYRGGATVMQDCVFTTPSAITFKEAASSVARLIRQVSQQIGIELPDPLPLPSRANVGV